MEEWRTRVERQSARLRGGFTQDKGGKAKLKQHKNRVNSDVGAQQMFRAVTQQGRTGIIGRSGRAG